MQKQVQATSLAQENDLKADKQPAEKSYNFYNKRKSIVQKVQEFSSLYNQDIYIVMKDKKSNKLSQFTSNKDEFSLATLVQLLLNQTKADKAAPATALLDELHTFLSQKQLNDDGLKDAAENQADEETHDERNHDFGKNFEATHYDSTHAAEVHNDITCSQDVITQMLFSHDDLCNEETQLFGGQKPTIMTVSK